MKEISLEEFLAGVELRKSLIAQVKDYEAHPERGIDITDMTPEQRIEVARRLQERVVSAIEELAATLDEVDAFRDE